MMFEKNWNKLNIWIKRCFSWVLNNINKNFEYHNLFQKDIQMLKIMLDKPLSTWLCVSFADVESIFITASLSRQGRETPIYL